MARLSALLALLALAPLPCQPFALLSLGLRGLLGLLVPVSAQFTPTIELLNCYQDLCYDKAAIPCWAVYPSCPSPTWGCYNKPDFAPYISSSRACAQTCNSAFAATCANCAGLCA